MRRVRKFIAAIGQCSAGVRRPLSATMKRLAALVFFAALGTGAGLIAARIALAFKPVCGYECDIRSFGIWFAITGGCLIGFPVLGQAFTRGLRLTPGRIAGLSIFLVTSVLFGVACFYVVDLRTRYADAEVARPVWSDFDFMYMTITKRDVQAYTKAAGGIATPLTVIPQWQRCALDGAWCDTNPKKAHMRCKSGEVYVNEADWSALALIPTENIRGAVPMKSTNLCAPGNIPDY